MLCALIKRQWKLKAKAFLNVLVLIYLKSWFWGVTSSNNVDMICLANCTIFLHRSRTSVTFFYNKILSFSHRPWMWSGISSAIWIEVSELILCFPCSLRPCNSVHFALFMFEPKSQRASNLKNFSIRVGSSSVWFCVCIRLPGGLYKHKKNLLIWECYKYNGCLDLNFYFFVYMLWFVFFFPLDVILWVRNWKAKVLTLFFISLLLACT